MTTLLFNGSTHMGWLLVLLVLISSMDLSRARPEEGLSMNSAAGDDETDVQDERRAEDLQKLRHFLLTSNSEQRTARRNQQELHKRELIREYLRSLDDPDTSRFQEIKKRFKTYCNSYEDVVNSNWAACG